MADGQSSTLNKGEASECYAFIHILEQEIIPLANEKLQPTEKSISFASVEKGGHVYTILPNHDIEISDLNTKVTVAHSKIESMAKKLLTAIKLNDKLPDDAPEVVEIKEQLKIEQISAGSHEKCDLTAEIEAPESCSRHKLGFSVKSLVGEPPTLINANHEKSLFLFKILTKEGNLPDEKQIKTIKTISRETVRSSKRKYKDTVQSLYANNFQLRFEKICGKKLTQTLSMIDSLAPKILGEMMVEHYLWSGPSNQSASLSQLVDEITQKQKIPNLNNQFGDNDKEVKESLRYKVKHILSCFAAGATVSTKWDGNDNATGGMLIVQKEGPVVCLELYSMNLGNYLITHTKFESPSSGRHLKKDNLRKEVGLINETGLIYRFEDDEQPFLGLLFQVRFKKDPADKKNANTKKSKRGSKKAASTAPNISP